MAENALSIPVPTRRTLFGGALTLTALAALPHVSKAKPNVSDAEFVRSIEGLVDGGGDVARIALSAGMKPADLRHVHFPGGLFASSRHSPVLDFYNEQTDRFCSFDPSGWRVR